MKFCYRYEFATEKRWLNARKKGVGASDSAAILGYGFANQNVLTVYADKVADDEPDDPPETPSGPSTADRMVIGKIIEKSVVEIFQYETRLRVDRPKDGMFHLYQSEAHPFMLATPDGCIVGQNAGLELKNIDAYTAWEWDDGATPGKYEIQCQHQMAVTGWDRVYLYALAGGSRTILRIVERDDPFIDILIKGNKVFWEHVESRSPLTLVDGTPASTDAIKRMYRYDDGRGIVLPDEFGELANQLDRLDETKKSIDQEIDAIKNRIKVTMGNHEIGYCRNGAEFHWKTITVNYNAKDAYTATQRRFTRKG